MGEEQYDALHPWQVEELGAHLTHLRKEVAEEAHDLTVDPVHGFSENIIDNKIPNKH